MSLQDLHTELQQLEKELFEIQNEDDFISTTDKVFFHQYQNNPVYREYCDYVGKTPGNIKDITEIPFLPIDFFKTHTVLTGGSDFEKVFRSSGTTGMQRSKHYIRKNRLYEQSYRKTFETFYGSPADYCILALLPGYLENKHSSLVSMVHGLISLTTCPQSGFYLEDMDALANTLVGLDNEGRNVILLGVSFALLDLVEKYPLNLKNTLIMETGGMKGRRKEVTREELHEVLKSGFGVRKIHSEYGMAELLSQAYSQGNGTFQSPPWMKVLIRDAYDPFDKKDESINQTVSGGINIIDLANLYSCSFIETKDLGRAYPDGKFEVLGRMDYSDIRGCNLMVM